MGERIAKGNKYISLNLMGKVFHPKGHLQRNPEKYSQSSPLHWLLCGTFCALVETRLSHAICILYPQLLLENFRL